MAALGFEPRHLAPDSALKSPLHYTARPCNRLPSKLASFLDIEVAWNHKHTITPLPLKILFILSLLQPRRLGSPPTNCGSDEGSACDWPPSSSHFLGGCHLSSATSRFLDSTPSPGWVSRRAASATQRSGGHSTAVTGRFPVRPINKAPSHSPTLSCSSVGNCY